MKNLILTLAYILFTLNSFSQLNPSIKKWNFGIEAFPNFTYEIVSNDGTADFGTENAIRDNETDPMIKQLYERWQ